MKKLKRIISVLIAAVTAFTMATTECFADDENTEDNLYFSDDELNYFFFGDYFFRDYQQFSTSLKPKFTAEVTSYGICLSFDYVENASFYRIYRYDKKRDKFVKLDDTQSTVYFDTDVMSNTSYTYKVRVYQKDGKTTKKSKMSSKVKIKTPLMPVRLNVAVTDKKIKLSWKKDSAADGYEIYYYKTARKKSDKNGTTLYDPFSGSWMSYNESERSLKYAEEKADFVKLKRTSSDSLSIKRDKKYKYYFKIRPYQIKNGKRKYGAFSDIMPSTRMDFMFNGVKGKSKNTLDVISYRSDVTPWTMSISESDKEIFRKFEKEHFTNDMSFYDKAEYLALYIHYSVDYAYGDDYSKISGLSCADAVFNKHSGQCYQYNGALAEFLSYMGFDVRLVSGYRGTNADNRKSHFWCEITIDGKKYILDAGNKKDGLYNLLIGYENTRYLIDQ